MQTTARDNREQGRHELFLGDDVAAYVKYRLSDHQIALDHTEVTPDHRGEGLGSAVVRSTLDDARGKHLWVLPHCPFVADFIKRHSEYADLVPAERHDEFGIAA